jgi:hypothetical protein
MTDTNFTINLLEPGPYYFRNKLVTFFIELERLTSSFHDTLYNDVRISKSPLDNSTFTEKYIRPVAETLQHLNHKYKFYHGDLHTGNIMFAGDTIKIIDFGLSCITYNGKLYSGELERSCVSSDLGIYLVSILEYFEHDNLLSPDTIKQLKNLLTINHNGNDYNIWRTVSEIQEKFNRGKAEDDMVMKFHVMYPWTAPWKVNNKLLINVILSITPDFILSKLDAGNKHNVNATCEQLLAACKDKNHTSALKLIKGGAELNCVDTRKMTPLIYASQFEELDGVAARLIEKGAELDLVDRMGQSPLILACIFKRAATAMLLINKGANVKLKDTDDNTALEYARISKLDNVEEAIEEKLKEVGKGGGRTRRLKRRNRTRKA